MSKGSRIHVEVCPPVLAEQRLVLSARVHAPGAPGRLPSALHFELPAHTRDEVVIQGAPDDIHDAFLRALVMVALQRGQGLLIHGSVSRELLENLEVFQRVACSWSAGLRPVSLDADTEVVSTGATLRARHDETMLAFSGGLSATHSLYAHHYGLLGRASRVIPDSLLVQGLESMVEQARLDELAARARRISDALASRLVTVRTNLHQFLPQAQPLALSCGLAAALSLFQRKYATGLIASTYGYDNPYTSGRASTPLTDPLLSSDQFQIVHDLADRPRVEKAEQLKRFEELDALHVCQLPHAVANCGMCPACIEHMLCVKAVGGDWGDLFRTPLSVDTIRHTSISDAATLVEWQTCLAYAVSRGRADSAEFRAMRQVIQRAEEALTAAPGALSSGGTASFRRLPAGG